MRILDLRALQGGTAHGYLAALGAARLAAQRWPEVALSWEREWGTAVLTDGPSTLEELLDALQDVIDSIPPGAVLPGVDPSAPPAGRDWIGQRRTAGDPGWGGPDGELWQGSLVTWEGHLHPLIRPHAAQTLRGMLAKPLQLLREQPDLLRQALTALGTTPDYPGGLWILRAGGTTGDPAAASPGRDWLAIMSIPLTPARQVLDVRSLGDCGTAVGWTSTLPQKIRWRLWHRPVPVSALRALLDGPLQGHLRDGPVLQGGRPADRRQPPLLTVTPDRLLDIDQVAELLRVRPASVARYVRRNDLQPPVDGRWLESTIRAYIADAPARAARRTGRPKKA